MAVTKDRFPETQDRKQSKEYWAKLRKLDAERAEKARELDQSLRCLEEFFPIHRASIPTGAFVHPQYHQLMGPGGIRWQTMRDPR